MALGYLACGLLPKGGFRLCHIVGMQSIIHILLSATTFGIFLHYFGFPKCLSKSSQAVQSVEHGGSGPLHDKARFSTVFLCGFDQKSRIDEVTAGQRRVEVKAILIIQNQLSTAIPLPN